MGATSVALDSQFAGAICNAIIGWREQNNLPTKDGVDIPMPRPPKGERWVIIDNCIKFCMCIIMYKFLFLFGLPFGR